VIGGYSVLQISDFSFYSTLSTMVTTTMLISVFFALFLLRSLMMIFKPRFIFGKNQEQYFRRVEVAEAHV
jgi:predicted RND superfamily exporter protein